MRLRDLLPRLRRASGGELGSTPTVPADAQLLVLPPLDRDSWRSDLCKADRPEAHAKCGHPMNVGRTDGCSCACHTPTSYDDGGAP